MKHSPQFVAVILLLIAGCGDSGSSAGREGGKQHPEGTQRASVQLALNWYPEAEHGGYFAADELGIYGDHQLTVEIIPGSPGTSRVILQELATRRVSFAVSSADQVVEQRARGLPIVALFAPVQQSPRCIMVHKSSGIGSLEELANLELSVSETRPFALWMKKQLPLNGVTFVPFSGLVGEFLSKPNFAQQAYVFSEPFIATEHGSDPVSLMLSDIGYNPYASVLVTSEQMLAEHPETVKLMQKAVRAGWLEYLKDSNSTNKRIHAENSDMSLAALEYGATALTKLCQTEDDAPVGTMTSARWQQLIDQLVELEVIETNSVQAEECYLAQAVELTTE